MGWEAGTWFLSIGALVPSLLLTSCYPEWSLFCITVTIKNAWWNVRMLSTWTTSLMDALVYSCRHGCWCRQLVITSSCLTLPGCLGGKSQTFMSRIGRKELRTCPEGLLSCSCPRSKREYRGDYEHLQGIIAYSYQNFLLEGLRLSLFHKLSKSMIISLC